MSPRNQANRVGRKLIKSCNVANLCPKSNPTEIESLYRIAGILERDVKDFFIKAGISLPLMPNSITSLALIRSSWEHSRSDYLETFVPLIATLILKRNYELIEPHHLEEFKKDFELEYGLLIPYSPIQQILKRLTRKGFLNRVEKNYTPDIGKLKKLDISNKSDRFEKEFEDVLAALKLFILEKTDETFEFEELENGLTNFLKQNDQAVLFAAEQKSFLPKVKSPKKLDHLIAEFVSYSHRHDRGIFNFILNITVGYSLTGTILYNEFNAFQGKLKGVNVYFDTTFIFDLLGIDGRFKQKLAKELVEILKGQGVNLFLLQTNQGEVEANLSECLRYMDEGKTDPSRVNNLTFKQCFQNGISNSDLEEIVVGFEDTLKEYGIAQEVVPDFVENKAYQIDEDKFYDLVMDIYSSRKAKLVSVGGKEEEENKEKLEKSGKRNNTVLRDVKVISGMYRFREGKKPATIKDCNAIFITTNSTLAYASHQFEKKEYNTRHTLPVAITDVFLGTLIWLQSPAEISNLREKKLLIDCLTSVQPSEKLIKKYVEQIEKLNEKGKISHDIVYLMRAHRSAYNILESKTLGDPDEVNENSVKDIMAELIAEIKQEETERHEVTSKELEQVISERDEAIVKVNKARDQRIADLKAAFMENKEQINASSDRIEALRRTAVQKINRLFFRVLIAWILALVIMGVLTYHFGWNIMEPIVWFIGAGTPVLSYAYFFNIGKHFNPKDIHDTLIEKKLGQLMLENGLTSNQFDILKSKKSKIIQEIKELRATK